MQIYFGEKSRSGNDHKKQQVPFDFAQGRLSTPHPVPFGNAMLRPG
jgi:hypothetical protein